MTETTILTAQAITDGDIHLTETTIATSAYALAAAITTIADLSLTSGARRPEVWLYAISLPDIGTFDATTKAQIRQTAGDNELAVRCIVGETSGLIRSTLFPLSVATGNRLYTWLECSHVTTSTLTITLTLMTV